MASREHILLFVFCSFLFASCAGTSVTVHAPPAKRSYSTAEIYNSDTKHPELSQQITRAVAFELRSRGVIATIRDVGDAPSETVDLLVVHTSDWPWDLARYLASLEIKLVDRNSKEIVGAGTYEGTTWHDFPQPAVIVRNIFEDFDRRGVFRTRASAGAE
ncbi:MAG: hypothetical protein DME97_14750 [Verrucomicrobia bacterium]|nr:MAG: hypothetical protein DME97_14750 [Verrucomicrobiota bacterium]